MTNIGDFVYFALIQNWLSQRIIQFSADVMGRAMTWVSAVALVLVTLWVLIQGYRLITGQSREPLTAVVANMSRVAVVVSMASTMALGGLQLQEFFTNGLARGINELVTGSATSPIAAIDKNLAYTQLAMGAIDAVQVPADDVATARTKARALLVATLGTAGPAMAAGAMLLLYQVAMALVIGFGPLFVLCLAFNSTKELFHRWLMYGLGTLFSMAVLNLVISLVLELTLRVAGALWGTQALSATTGANAEGFTSQAMQQGGVGLLVTVLIVSTPPMAAAFFRGVLGQFLSFSAFGMGAGAFGASRRRASHGAAYGQAASMSSGRNDSDGENASLHRASWDHTSRVASNSSTNAALDYIKKHEWSGMSDTSAPQRPGQRYVDTYGGEAPLTSGAADGGPSAAELAGRFAKGAAHGAVDMVWQPVAQVLDLGQVAYGTAYGFATGGLYEPRWFSAIGQNYEAGMGYGETVTRAVLGSNPVTGVGMASFDLTGSALKGDWGGVAEGAGGLVGGFALAKYGQRYLAPEPGAQLGIKRLGTELPYDIVDSTGVSGGNLPPLPAGNTNTFSGIPVAREFGAGELSRVYEAGNRKAPLEGRYWATEPPTSEAGWRGPYAALKDWGNAGTDLATLQRPSTWAWYGETAAMAVPNRHSFTVGNYAIGWYQPGGKSQAMLPNSFFIVNPGNVKTTPTPWRKP